MQAENIHFNAKIYSDFMYIEGYTVLDMVDDSTHFHAVPFVDPLITESIWETKLALWRTVYTGQPNTLFLDDESQFRNTFVEICEIHDFG